MCIKTDLKDNHVMEIKLHKSYGCISSKEQELAKYSSTPTKWVTVAVLQFTRVLSDVNINLNSAFHSHTRGNKIIKCYKLSQQN